MNASRTYSRADAGFTLVELLTGIAVLSLVLTIAPPCYGVRPHRRAWRRMRLIWQPRCA
jgi:prepilin-type N-terminal cleavage/methylation domain-containing protein